MPDTDFFSESRVFVRFLKSQDQSGIGLRDRSSILVDAWSCWKVLCLEKWKIVIFFLSFCFAISEKTSGFELGYQPQEGKTFVYSTQVAVLRDGLTTDGGKEFLFAVSFKRAPNKQWVVLFHHLVAMPTNLNELASSSSSVESFDFHPTSLFLGNDFLPTNFPQLPGKELSIGMCWQWSGKFELFFRPPLPQSSMDYRIVGSLEKDSEIVHIMANKVFQTDDKINCRMACSSIFRGDVAMPICTNWLLFASNFNGNKSFDWRNYSIAISTNLVRLF